MTSQPSQVRLPTVTSTRGSGELVPASRASIWLALASVYVIWGSTYLAIRVAVRTMPPMLMAGARFVVAGALLYLVAERRGDRVADRPGIAQWRAAAIVGGMLLCIGNGAVVWAEQHIPSGLTALLLAPSPVWTAIVERVFVGRRLGLQATIGLVTGLAGLALLFGRSSVGHADLVASVVVVVAAMSWAIGSVYARHAPLPKRPLVSTSMQMLAGGAFLTLAGLLSGETARLNIAAISVESWMAWAFLMVFGSLVAFSAYAWLLRVAPTSLISTYSYVNPIVAVSLGWALLGEQVSASMIGAAAVIVIAVALIVTARDPPPR